MANKTAEPVYISFQKLGKLLTEKGKKWQFLRDSGISTIRSVRGISFNDYDELFLDEFIPEESAVKHASDGATCINAFETIFSNRELPPFPMPPMKVWMASNAINLFDPILNALNLADLVAQMEIHHQKVMTVPERDLYLYHGTEKSVADAKANTSLYKMIGKDSEMAQHMLYGNFRGDYVNLIRRKVNFKEYECIFDIDEKVYVYMNKINMGWFVCTVRQNSKMHFSSKVPLDLRKRFQPRYTILNSCNLIQYERAELIDYLNAFLG